MVKVTYDDWYETSGYLIQMELEDWFDSAPIFLDIDSIISGNIDDFISYFLMDSYESYISEYEDYCYERYKDECNQD